MRIEFNSAEEMFEYLEAMRKHFATEGKKPMTNAEKQKAYRERKRVTDGNEIVTDGNTDDREEREEKEAGSSPLSPSSPSSFPSDSPNNIPITPYNPPLPEEKGEREERVSAKAKPEKYHFGEYRHVLLTADEAQKLTEKFPDVAERIRRLDEYLENNRKKHYDSHYLTILNWARKDEGKQQQPIQQPRLTPSQIGRMLDEMEQKKTEQVVDL